MHMHCTKSILKAVCMSAPSFHTKLHACMQATVADLQMQLHAQQMLRQQAAADAAAARAANKRLADVEQECAQARTRCKRAEALSADAAAQLARLISEAAADDREIARLRYGSP